MLVELELEPAKTMRGIAEKYVCIIRSPFPLFLLVNEACEQIHSRYFLSFLLYFTLTAKCCFFHDSKESCCYKFPSIRN